MLHNQVPHIAVALTGASGMPIGYQLIKALIHQKAKVSVLYSEAAQRVSVQETSLPLSDDFAATQTNFQRYFNAEENQLRIYSRMDWDSPLASGSNGADAMAVCPCTMGTAAAIAHGLSTNLLTRAADVMIKERKPLVLVPRESPLSPVHLKNLLTLSRLGVSIIPPMLTFYHHPHTIDDMVSPIVERILKHIGLPAADAYKWGENFTR